MNKLAAARWLVILVALVAEDACNSPSSPTAATPPPVAVVTTPPPPDPPTVTCPGSIVTTSNGGGAAVSYTTPAAEGGQSPVSVTCTPASGSTFAAGSTQVSCAATDGLNRSTSCTFSVTINEIFRLRRTRFLAFGDSITAGEMVVPGTDDSLSAPVPAVAYPTVLQQLLQTRYSTQQPVVANAGRGGELASQALDRFIFEYGKAAPEAVIILEGYNELFQLDPIAAIDTLERGVSRLAAEARNRGARVFIATLAPTKPGRRQIPMYLIERANDRIRGIVRGEGAALIDVFTPLLADVNNNVGSDGVHLTELGYRRLAEAVLAAIRADLEIR